MKPKFEIDDRVIYKPTNSVGTVMEFYPEECVYSIRFDYDEDSECFTIESNLEFENPKLAFLTRLQELLATFDAKISGGGYDGYGDYLVCSIGQDPQFSLGQYSEYGDRPTVTAENVFDYDTD